MVAIALDNGNLDQRAVTCVTRVEGAGEFLPSFISQTLTFVGHMPCCHCSLDHGVISETNQPRAHNDIGNAVRAVIAANIIYELAFKF